MRRFLFFLVACSGPSSSQQLTSPPAEDAQAPAASGPQAPSAVVEVEPPAPPPAPTNIIVDGSAFSALFAWRDQDSSRRFTTSISAGGDTVAVGIAPDAGLCGVTGCPNSASLVRSGDGTIITRNDYVMSYNDPYPSAQLYTFVSNRGDAYIGNEGQSASTGPYAIDASQVNPAFLVSQGIETRVVTDGYSQPLRAWAAGGSTAYVTCVQTGVSTIECQLITESGGQRTVRTTQPAYVSLSTKDGAGRLYLYSAADDRRFYMYDGTNFVTINPTSTGNATQPQLFGNQFSFLVGSTIYSMNNGTVLTPFTDAAMTSGQWIEAKDGGAWLAYQTASGLAFAGSDGMTWRKFVPSTTAVSHYQTPVPVSGEYLVAYKTSTVCAGVQMGLRIDAFNLSSGAQRNVWRKDDCNTYYGDFTIARDGTVMLPAQGACVHRFAASGTNVDGATTQICPPVSNVSGAGNPVFAGQGAHITADPVRNGAWYFIRSSGVDANASFNLQYLPTTGAPGVHSGPFTLRGAESPPPWATNGVMYAASRTTIYHLTDTGPLQILTGTGEQAAVVGSDNDANVYVRYPLANGKFTFATLGKQAATVTPLANDLDPPSKINSEKGKAWILLTEDGYQKGSLFMLGNSPRAIFEHAEVTDTESHWKHGYIRAESRHVFYHVLKGTRIDFVDSQPMLGWAVRATDDLLVAIFEDVPGKMRIYKHPIPN